MIDSNDEWIANIKQELSNMGLDYLWHEEHPDKYVISLIEQRLNDIYKQTVLTEIARSSKGFFISTFDRQFYITILLI